MKPTLIQLGGHAVGFGTEQLFVNLIYLLIKQLKCLVLTLLLSVHSLKNSLKLTVMDLLWLTDSVFVLIY